MFKLTTTTGPGTMKEASFRKLSEAVGAFDGFVKENPRGFASVVNTNRRKQLLLGYANGEKVKLVDGHLVRI